jgi:hypothetical protein
VEQLAGESLAGFRAFPATADLQVMIENLSGFWIPSYMGPEPIQSVPKHTPAHPMNERDGTVRIDALDYTYMRKRVIRSSVPVPVVGIVEEHPPIHTHKILDRDLLAGENRQDESGAIPPVASLSDQKAWCLQHGPGPFCHRQANVDRISELSNRQHLFSHFLFPAGHPGSTTVEKRVPEALGADRSWMGSGKLAGQNGVGGAVVGDRTAMEEGMTIGRKAARGRSHGGATGKHREDGKKNSQLEDFQRSDSPHREFYPTHAYMSIKLPHCPTSIFALICTILCAFIFSGCPASAWEQVRVSEDVNELRAFIRTSPNDIHVSDALRKIAYLEYQRAVATDTHYAYRMFLERHTSSVHAFEVKRRLEHLDFLEAKRQGSLEAVLDFMRTWPQGNYNSKAQKLADGLYCKRFLESNDPDSLSAFLAVHPNVSCRGDLLSLRVNLLFEGAVRSGSVAKLIEFIHAHPSASVVKEARSMLTRKQVEALVRAARFEEAQKVVKKHAYSSQHAALMNLIGKARIEWIRSSLDPALIRKLAASSDPGSKKELRRWAGKIAARRRTYRSLAKATAQLRSPLVEAAIGDTTAVDPRLRWLDADRLALSPEEATAEFLLDLLGDSFLQVRVRSLESLQKVVAGLGKVRAEIWLVQKKAQLVPKAKTGILLYKVATLHELSGQPKEALKRLEEEIESKENPDPFVLYHAARLAGRLGQKNKAATLTRGLSEVLVRFYRQRVQAWAELYDSERGWLTLRQIYGVRSLWRKALAPYLPDKSGRTSRSPAEELLGNWLERSRTDLQALDAWFEQAERKWALRNPDYVVCHAPNPDTAVTQEHAVEERDAVLLLALSPMPESRRTISWAACCHPRQTTRLLAITLPQAMGFTWLIK